MAKASYVVLSDLNLHYILRELPRTGREPYKILQKDGGPKNGPPKTGLWDKDMSRVPRCGNHWISCDYKIVQTSAVVKSEKTLVLSNEYFFKKRARYDGNQ
jgi:hypothetical protein